MTTTVLLVFGSPARLEVEAQLLRWYEPHLEQMGSLPGIVSAQLYRPSARQLAPSPAPLPGTLGLYVYETDDFPAAFAATWASHHEGVRTGRYVPGKSIPVPGAGTAAHEDDAPWADVFTLDPRYQTAQYDLVSRRPEGDSRRGLAPTILLGFGSPAGPGAEDRMLGASGVVSAQLYRPNELQAPRLTTTLPDLLGVYEYDDASELGSAPPWGDALIPDAGYRPACYDLALAWQGEA